MPSLPSKMSKPKTQIMNLLLMANLMITIAQEIGVYSIRPIALKVGIQNHRSKLGRAECITLALERKKSLSW